MAASLSVDIYLDLICPWCLIGKRHLDEALRQFQQTTPETAVQLHWHSVQLLPDTPAQGWDFQPFYLKRLGSPEGVRQRQAQVNAAAQVAGLQIDFTRIPVMPNTLQAHQLLNFASGRLSVPDFAVLLERLFAAHFHEGRNLGERSTLLSVAVDLGLNSAALNAWIDAGAGQPQALDVPGVPFFVFNRQSALSGAQPVNTLLFAMRQACAADPMQAVL